MWIDKLIQKMGKPGYRVDAALSFRDVIRIVGSKSICLLRGMFLSIRIISILKIWWSSAVR